MSDYKPTGKKAIFGEKAKNTTIKLYSWEIIPVKEFIKKLREDKKKELKNNK